MSEKNGQEQNEQEQKVSKRERVVNHLKEHKTTYICAAAGAVVGAAVGVVVGSSMKSPEAVVETKGIFYKSPVNITQIVERRGHPGYVIMCNETGEQFASIRRTAKLLGLNPSHISEHLKDLRPDVKGLTFTLIGEAQ